MYAQKLDLPNEQIDYHLTPDLTRMLEAAIQDNFGEVDYMFMSRIQELLHREKNTLSLDQIVQAIDRLPNYFRLMAVLILVGFPHKKIAPLLGVSGPTASRHKGFLMNDLADLAMGRLQKLISLEAIALNHPIRSEVVYETVMIVEEMRAASESLEEIHRHLYYHLIDYVES
jgi:hypothetical protein